MANGGKPGLGINGEVVPSDNFLPAAGGSGSTANVIVIAPAAGHKLYIHSVALKWDTSQQFDALASVEAHLIACPADFGSTDLTLLSGYQAGGVGISEHSLTMLVDTELATDHVLGLIVYVTNPSGTGAGSASAVAYYKEV